ncbi:hypothetical protein EJB05_45182, partial [Eragrostis curvula]
MPASSCPRAAAIREPIVPTPPCFRCAAGRPAPEASGSAPLAALLPFRIMPLPQVLKGWILRSEETEDLPQPSVDHRMAVAWTHLGIVTGDRDARCSDRQQPSSARLKIAACGKSNGITHLATENGYFA